MSVHVEPVFPRMAHYGYIQGRRGQLDGGVGSLVSL